MKTAKAKPIGLLRPALINICREAGWPDSKVMAEVNRAALGHEGRQRRVTVKGQRYELLQCPECGSDEHPAAECDNLG
jgi:hypothetical protein